MDVWRRAVHPARAALWVGYGRPLSLKAGQCTGGLTPLYLSIPLERCQRQREVYSGREHPGPHRLGGEGHNGVRTVAVITPPLVATAAAEAAVPLSSLRRATAAAASPGEGPETSPDPLGAEEDGQGLVALHGDMIKRAAKTDLIMTTNCGWGG